jgi:hypothetical protein
MAASTKRDSILADGLIPIDLIWKEIKFNGMWVLFYLHHTKKIIVVPAMVDSISCIDLLKSLELYCESKGSEKCYSQ